jgi:lysozyme
MARSAQKITGAAVAVSIATVALIQPWEGLSLRSYPDVIGVWTACWGETRNIREGQTFTREQCDSQLSARVAEFELAIRPCLPLTLPDKTRAAFISLAYNIGSGGFCKSSIARLAKAGNLQAACDRILLYNKAGGRVVRGLVNRRNAERDLCLAGLRGA